MLRIHHIEGRRSERIAWLLEEIGGVDYEMVFVPGDIAGSLFQIEPIHEMRMTPVLEDGDLILVESGAIIEYILSTYAKNSPLRPPEGTRDYARYLEFMHFAEGSAMARILLDFLLDMMQSPSPMPPMPGLAGSRSQSQRVMHFADNVLGTRRYFAGESFTAADIMMHFALKVGAPLAVTGKRGDVADLYRTDHEYLETFPNVKRFLIDMAERPAFQRALARAMPNGPPAF